MSKSLIAALIAAIPAVYLGWRIIVVGRQDGRRTDLIATVLIIVAGTVWGVLFFFIGLVLGLW